MLVVDKSTKKRQWATGGILEEVAREEICGIIYRSGILFQGLGEWTFRDHPLQGVYAVTKCTRE